MKLHENACFSFPLAINPSPRISSHFVNDLYFFGTETLFPSSLENYRSPTFPSPFSLFSLIWQIFVSPNPCFSDPSSSSPLPMSCLNPSPPHPTSPPTLVASSCNPPPHGNFSFSYCFFPPIELACRFTFLFSLLLAFFPLLVSCCVTTSDLPYGFYVHFVTSPFLLLPTTHTSRFLPPVTTYLSVTSFLLGLHFFSSRMFSSLL